jgi:hypothetical protein
MFVDLLVALQFDLILWLTVIEKYLKIERDLLIPLVDNMFVYLLVALQFDLILWLTVIEKYLKIERDLLIPLVEE